MRIIRSLCCLFGIVFLISCGDNPSSATLDPQKDAWLNDLMKRRIMYEKHVKIDLNNPTKIVKREYQGRTIEIRIYLGANDFNTSFIKIGENPVLIEVTPDEAHSL